MRIPEKEVNDFLTSNLELTLEAFRGDHRSESAKQLVLLLREKFNYSSKTVTQDIFRGVKSRFIKQNSYKR